MSGSSCASVGGVALDVGDGAITLELLILQYIWQKFWGPNKYGLPK